MNYFKILQLAIPSTPSTPSLFHPIFFCLLCTEKKTPNVQSQLIVLFVFLINHLDLVLVSILNMV